METEELKITIPEGQEIDWQESAKQEKIIFKKKNIKPRSWAEYVAQHKQRMYTYFFIDNISKVRSCAWYSNIGMDPDVWKNALPTKELADAFLAMMQIMSLRQDWIHKWSLERGLTKDWEPDWKNDDDKKWCITFCNCKLRTDFFMCNAVPLSFPTKEMAEDFMNCFKDLLEIARPLI